MGSVSLLSVDEWVDIDGTFLGEMMLQLGPETAERLIEDALAALRTELGTISTQMAAIAAVSAPGGAGPRRDAVLDGSNDHAAREPYLAELVASCDRLSRMAWEIGLTTLSGVAVDVALCAERGDRTALAAVEARLQRVGGRSLGPDWEEAIFGLV